MSNTTETKVQKLERIEKSLKKLYKELETLEASKFCLDHLKDAYGDVGLKVYFMKNPNAFR